MSEIDPTGRGQHDKGSKLDAGKYRPALVLGGFALALIEVSKVGSFGAIKYTEDGWKHVPNGETRYDDACLRHWLEEKTGERHDQQSELQHAAHTAWNALARLNFLCEQRNKVKDATHTNSNGNCLCSDQREPDPRGHGGSPVLHGEQAWVG